MPKPMSLSPLLAPAAILLLTVTASAQLHSGMPAPLPGIPITPPPVDHPALAAQPLFNDGGSSSRSSPSTKSDDDDKSDKSDKKAGKKMDPAIAGPKVAGRDLSKAVKSVAALKWHEKLPTAKAHAVAADKPILWVQALGNDIDGFA